MTRRVAAAIEALLSELPKADQTSWRAELARSLAAALDEQPNASMARELRSTMAELTELAAPQEGDQVDDLAAARAARRSAASGS